MTQIKSKIQLIVLSSGIIILLSVSAWWFFTNSTSSSRQFDDKTAVYAGPFKLQVTIDPEQPKVGNNELSLIIVDENNQAVTDAKINAVAEMPAMGSMPAMPAPATMEHNGAGVYRGTFELLMNGAWPLSLDISSKSTGTAQLEFELTTSRSGLRLSSATETQFSTKRTEKSITNIDSSANTTLIDVGLYRIDVKLDPSSPIVGSNQLTIVVYDKTDNSVLKAKVRVAAQKTLAGSKLKQNSAAEITETKPGIYTGNLELPIAGLWFLVVDVESNELGHGDVTLTMTTGQPGLVLASATPDGISHYTCSMHPSVKSTTPGSCPICAMTLVPVTKKELSSGRITMDARRRQLIGVTTARVELKNLTQTIRAAGRITYNETRLTDITLKYTGWIGTLDADFVGVSVVKGKSLFSVYSPELLSAQQEYLETLQRRTSNAGSVLRAARLRLSLWDISMAQIKQLEKRKTPIEYLSILSPVNGIVIDKKIVAGSAVQAGQKLLRIANLNSVWVEADIYEYEIPLVQVGNHATVVLPTLSDKTRSGTINYISPYLIGASRTATVRLELDNSDGILKPNMYAHLHIKVDLGKRLVVPESAVLYAGTSRVVFVDLGKGILQPRKITTGLRNADYIEVVQGLKNNDIVVTSGNFLIAAESKLKAGINQW